MMPPTLTGLSAGETVTAAVAAVAITGLLVTEVVSSLRRWRRDRKRVTRLLRAFGDTPEGRAFAATNRDQRALAALDRELDDRARTEGLLR